tara:strand:- start:475 stop:1038 length:564 start_codon:yes stop_codon:yes gene_type:complete
MDFDKVIKKRASIKDYSFKKVKYDKVIDAIEAANLAPSPGNLPIISYIIVEDPEKISKIADACQQDFVRNAKTIVVLCSDRDKVDIMYEGKAETYIKQHAGAAIENFLLKITDMKLASCWVGAFSERTVKNVLKIPALIGVEAVLPIAYPTKADKTVQAKKRELGRIVYFEKWKNKFQKRPKETGTH